jgi:hypothetical protein
MKVFILTSTARSDNNTQIEGVFFNITDAQKKMREFFESSKKFWEDYEKEWNCRLTDVYQDIYIQIGETYAEAYCVDADYEETGMSWKIIDADVK